MVIKHYLRSASSGGDSDEQPSPKGTIPREETHEILRNDRRRAVLQVLQTTPEITVRELSEQVAAMEVGETPPPRDRRQSVYVSLVQTHLPKLAQAAVVSYDEQAKMVSQQAAAEQLYRQMEPMEPEVGTDTDPATAEDPLFAMVLVSIPIGGLLTGLAFLGVPVLSAIPLSVWVFFTVGIVSVYCISYAIVTATSA